MNFDIEIGGHPSRVTVERDADLYRVEIGGQIYAVDLAHVDGTTLSMILRDHASKSYEVGLAERPTLDEWEVYLRAGVVYTRVDGHGRTRRVRRAAGVDPFAGTSGLLQVVAPMPGRIVRVLVAAGDEVAARQGLVVVEAMKMENELRAPRAARVKDVHAIEGTTVEAGRVLVVLE